MTSPTTSTPRCTRIIGHMVTYNEMGRYLSSTIRWLRDVTDVQYVYDDRSTDGTYGHIQRAGVPVRQRRPGDPSFTEDESVFRANAWQAMEAHHRPSPSDWILCVDADEFIVAPRPDETSLTLTETIERHMRSGAVTMHVNEVFGFDGQVPLLRVDGFWGQILACRLVRWRPNAQFPPRHEGGGSVPADWTIGAGSTGNLTIMHLGYARTSDRAAKHARYSATDGHNPRHIASILEPGTLVRWEGLEVSWHDGRPHP